MNATYPKVALNASAKVAANKEPKPFRNIQDILRVRPDKTSNRALHSGVIETLGKVDRDCRIDLPSFAYGGRPGSLSYYRLSVQLVIKVRENSHLALSFPQR